ncbi:MAG: carbamoyltransferase, partial [Chloroflexi bacterium]|nr:carbamoyltransferase [Chloroflexota bacterium]
MNILGINAYHGDAAACLVQDGQLIAAVAEERFNRKKHCAGFPTLAIKYCLEAGGIQAGDLDHIAISRNPAAHIHKKVLSLAKSFIPRITTIKDRVANAGRVRSLDTEFSTALGIARSDLKAKFHHVEHHRAHLASAFLVSPFEDAAVLSVDGFGDFVSTMMGHGRGTNVEVLDWVEYPHSLGLLYTAASQYIGFPKYGDEGKVMGLAPCGTPRYLEQFQKIVRLLPGGKFELNLDYFLHHSQGVEMVWDEGTPVIGQVWSPAFVEALGPARLPTDPLEERHEDIAASLQRMLELALLHVCQNLHERTSSEKLCLAGGVALNCTFNGMIRENTPFKEVYIQAAAGDDGTSIGAAFHVHNQVNGARRTFVMQHPYTGPSFSDEEIAAVLKRRGVDAKRCESSTETTRETARAMARGDVVGWFQG